MMLPPAAPPPPPRPPLSAAPGPLMIRTVLAHASNFSHVRRVPTLIVIHATHGAEGDDKDETGALAITRPNAGKSWHYMIDANSITRSVPDELTAWHARRHGNRIGIGVELCGSADQTTEQWYDRASLPTLQLAARLCADLCLRWQIPPVFQDQRGLIAGRPGITTHAMVSAAWKESDHYDPGLGFPLGAFVDAVARATIVLGTAG